MRSQQSTSWGSARCSSAKAGLIRASPRSVTSSANKRCVATVAGRSFNSAATTASEQVAVAAPSKGAEAVPAPEGQPHAFNWRRAWYPVLPVDYLQKDRPQVCYNRGTVPASHVFRIWLHMHVDTPLTHSISLVVVYSILLHRY